MKINGSPYELPRPVGPAASPTGVPGRKETQPEPAASPSRSTRSDSVEISSAGRALAGAESSEAGTSLTPERLAELRQRVLEGAYNSVELADQVARRLLERGDV